MLKYILFVVLCWIVLFVLIGIVKPTVSHGHEITVDKPVEEAQAVTQDETK